MQPVAVGIDIDAVPRAKRVYLVTDAVGAPFPVKTPHLVLGAEVTAALAMVDAVFSGSRLVEIRELVS